MKEKSKGKNFSQAKPGRKSSKNIWERIVPLSKATREWDIDFWQAQKPEVRFRATWSLVVDSYRLKRKKIDESTFRLQRTVENIRMSVFYNTTKEGEEWRR